MVAKAEAAQGQTTINQEAVAIAAEPVLVAAEMDGSGSSNGDGGNGGDNTAAMAAVTAAPTWRRQWQRGRPMWAEVIFSKYLLLFT
jgi:hypothetical protein